MNRGSRSSGRITVRPTSTAGRTGVCAKTSVVWHHARPMPTFGIENRARSRRRHPDGSGRGSPPAADLQRRRHAGWRPSRGWRSSGRSRTAYLTASARHRPKAGPTLGRRPQFVGRDVSDHEAAPGRQSVSPNVTSPLRRQPALAAAMLHGLHAEAGHGLGHRDLAADPCPGPAPARGEAWGPSAGPPRRAARRAGRIRPPRQLRSRWSRSCSVPPRRMVMNRGSRSSGQGSR